MQSDMSSRFITEGVHVYGFDSSGDRVKVAVADDGAWAQTIADMMST